MLSEGPQNLTDEVQSVGKPDDNPWVGLDYPGFDVWLAAKYGVSDDRNACACFFEDLLWGPAMRAQADLNLGGRKSIES